ncbi:hypothetical protein [Mesobacillus foraminis]|uniref:hypothetical protein n=1 Tax=Mesobacillus foraminis TaxID=279826 RepID=UPI0013CE4558|nr:hypothetical protein [Mesobacillus foraminis]
MITVSIALSIFLLLTVSKKWQMIVCGMTVVLILIHVGMAINNSYKTTKHILSISPDIKHVLVIKENRETAVTTHYGTYYGIFARPKKSLPNRTNGNFKVKWLENDIAAVTYKAANNTIHQFIGTYGDRDGDYSYSYVGPSIHGEWKADNIKVISASEGITVDSNGIVERYDWDQVVQFGTIAVVLMGNNEAKWTIALNESFKSNSNESKPPSGEITIYKATMDNNEPIMLKYESS